MGCDGGTIPTRDEMVRLKKKPEQKDRDSERAFKWKHCDLTQEPLSQPIVSCQLGRLYSKESVIEFLLDKSKFQGVSRFGHIKGLKDVKTLQLTPNPSYTAPDSDKGGAYIDRNISPYICPISGLEMNGKYRFCYLHGCGCVFAERALKEIKTEACNKCGKPYQRNDVIIMNGSEEDFTMLQARMEQRKLQAKLDKKGRKKAAEMSTGAHLDAEDGPSTSKKMKSAEEPSRKALPNDAEASKSKLANGIPPSKAASSKVTNGKAADKKPKSVQEDPRASEAYKSLFTSHEKCLNQQKAHWVTHNPCYY